MGIFGGLSSAVGEKTEKTVIAKEARLKGDLETDALLLIDGQWMGEIRSTTEVSIGANGHFIGNLWAKHLVVNGQIEGSVHCDKLEILKNGRVEGEVYLKEFVIEAGGHFYGQSFKEVDPEADLANAPRLTAVIAS